MVAITADRMLTLLQDIALVVGLLAGLVTGLLIIGKSPIIGGPLRWIMRRLLVEPLASWFQHLVATAVDERITHRLNQPNGGSSLFDIGQGLKEIQRHLGLDGDDPEPGSKTNELR